MTLDEAIVERGEVLICFRVGGKVVAKLVRDLEDGTGLVACVALGDTTFKALEQLWDRLKEKEKEGT